MAWTKHGYHISGSPVVFPTPLNRFFCGGQSYCEKCEEEGEAYWEGAEKALKAVKRKDEMTFTSHGHYIDGSGMGIKPENVARCGGPGLCPQCSMETGGYSVHDIPSDWGKVGIPGGYPWDRAKIEAELETEKRRNEPTDYLERAKKLVDAYVGRRLAVNFESKMPVYDVYIVWFCKTLQNWKALVCTTLEDNMYYEVTYNGDKHETYLDVYSQINNICIPD
jgi:Family of unknown function (DUF6275)